MGGAEMEDHIDGFYYYNVCTILKYDFVPYYMTTFDDATIFSHSFLLLTFYEFDKK